MADDVTVDGGDGAIQEIMAEANKNYDNVSLESLVLLVNTERLNSLRKQANKELADLKKRQDQVTFLHNVLKKINVETSANGEFDSSKDGDFQQLLSKAKEMGVNIQDGKTKYTKDERDRLVDNIRMTVDDLNVLNDMQLQTINRLTNERYESYQLARATLKPLHEAKMQSSRGISK
ncbi:MAG: hypothetical protein H0X51_04580 [Parachlamydiaceae bacterium]|nr:hypothetical protein [Parachlamydiaceae bacterium]